MLNDYRIFLFVGVLYVKISNYTSKSQSLITMMHGILTFIFLLNTALMLLLWRQIIFVIIHYLGKVIEIVISVLRRFLDLFDFGTSSENFLPTENAGCLGFGRVNLSLPSITTTLTWLVCTLHFLEHTTMQCVCTSQLHWL
ncbi:hypothetical protein V8G54_024674 [Vigna mungo]|uniref:Uncharacterized protein n=1 Tax=Vigna mungo TaxID=3915 RepID=A0AAQ3N7V0_VIGMU